MFDVLKQILAELLTKLIFWIITRRQVRLFLETCFTKAAFALFGRLETPLTSILDDYFDARAAEEEKTGNESVAEMIRKEYIERRNSISKSIKTSLGYLRFPLPYIMLAMPSILFLNALFDIGILRNYAHINAHIKYILVSLLSIIFSIGFNGFNGNDEGGDKRI